VTQSDCYYQSLATLCGMGGFPTGVPNQWWRFILPIFLHIGVIDLVIMLGFQVRVRARGAPPAGPPHAERTRPTPLQLWRGTMVERDIGPIRMCIVYMVCGVFGIAMGANFSPGSGALARTKGGVAGTRHR
jgi:membrane associated rhomboid family serine protease